MVELPLADELRSFARRADSTVEGALIVSRIVRPDTDIAWCRDELRRLVGEAGADAGPLQLVDTLRGAGFAGAEQYYEVDNSALECVLRTRRGIPITLAMVVIGCAENLGMTASGINFPGHFMALVNGCLFDPFVMQPIDVAGRAAWLARSGATEDEAFRIASPRDVILRMLNNLRGLALSRGDHEAALELTDYQLVVAPGTLSLRVERAELWSAMGATEMARRELRSAIALATDSGLRSRLEQRLSGLDDTGPTLH